MQVQKYREKLRRLSVWDEFLLKESGLPGPRANLELAQAVADEGDEKLFERLVGFEAEQAPTNTPQEFLAVCGVIGLGKLVADGQRWRLKALRRYASDARWRVREAVAMALQRVGDADMPLLLKEMSKWSKGNSLEKRAAAAAVCEPRLLGNSKDARKVLSILDQITASLLVMEDRKSDGFIALKKGLGYCWSVAVAALPDEGKACMEKWFVSDDPAVRWIMKENLRKNRLIRVDKRWVERWSKRLS